MINSSKWPLYASIAQTAAENAAGLIEQIAARGFRVVSKDGDLGRDLQTEADLASEEHIRKALLGLDSSVGFCGEEAGEEFKKDGSPFWLVDPLDGTSNFAYGLAPSAVSIALIQDGVPIVGVVREIPAPGGRMLWAVRGGDQCPEISNWWRAWKRGPRIGFDWPRSNDKRTPILNVIEAFRDNSDGIRITGSAVVGASAVATGSLDAYFNPELLALDVAAVSVLLGDNGVVLDMNGDAWRPTEGKQGVVVARSIDFAHKILKVAA